MKKISLTYIMMFFCINFLHAQKLITDPVNIDRKSNISLAGNTIIQNYSEIYLEQGNPDPSADVIQQGMNNNISQFQSYTGFENQRGVKNSSNALQVGNNNNNLQIQVGQDNRSIIKSFGINNGIKNDEIKTEQSGNQNTAIIEEGLLKDISYNLASIQQTGNSDFAKIFQEGSNSNIARITQTSNNNLANISQTGCSNVSVIIQQ
jgi:hypothetical protein